MYDFTRELIRFRKAHADILSPTEYGQGRPLAWKTSSNADMSSEDWSTKRHMMMHYYRTEGAEGEELAILVNMETYDVSFTLPEGREWTRLIDTQSWFDQSGGFFDENPTADPFLSHNITLDSPAEIGASYTVKPFTMVVIKERL